MRIAHYCYGYFREGGIQTYVRTIAGAQAEMGHDIYIFDYLTDEMPRSSYTEPNSMYRAFTSPQELASLCKELHIEVLHLHDYFPESLRDTQSDTFVVRTIHHHGLHCPSGSKFFKSDQRVCERGFSYAGCLWGHLVNQCGSRRPGRILQNFLHLNTEKKVMADIPIIAVSEYLCKQIVEAGFPERMVQTLHLPVQVKGEHKLTPLQEGPPRFVFLGRIVPLKGLEWLIRAIAQTNASVHMDVAGDGYDADRMKSLSENLGLSDRVAFHGWLSGDEARKLVLASRAVIAPSLWPEPAGFTPFEAMAQGRAVIASKIGGLQESLQHGVNGLLVEANHTQAMAEAILTLARDRSLAQTMGEAGYRIVQTRFSLQQHIEKLMNIYREKVSFKTNRGVKHGEGA